MQYTNNILDLLVTIGYNIQSTVAYPSTGMELAGCCFFFTRVQRDNSIKQHASFCSSFYHYFLLDILMGLYHTMKIA